MKWQVVCKVGRSDGYDPTFRNAEPRLYVGFERSGDPHSMRQDVLSGVAGALGASPSATVVDLLYAAMSVYAADLCIPRQCADDAWTRDIRLHLAVADVATWQPVLPLLAEMLGFLSGDDWELCVHSHSRYAPPAARVPLLDDRPNAVALFSGGLDSLVGAIDLLAQGRRVEFVGQYGPDPLPREFQRRVWGGLPEELRKRGTRLAFHIQPPVIPGQYDKTMRCRSFLFLALGLAVADALSADCPLYVAENGFISLNVPLTRARMGSLSTRTTHPHFIGLVRQVLDVLGIRHAVNLPYRFKTKREMLSEVSNTEALRDGARLTMSCAHSSYNRFLGRSPKMHCGHCYPCIVRRAAMCSAGLPDADYVSDVLTETPDPGTETGRDIRAVGMAVRRSISLTDTRAMHDVLLNGPLPPEDIREYARVYARGMQELADFVTQRG